MARWASKQPTRPPRACGSCKRTCTGMPKKASKPCVAKRARRSARADRLATAAYPTHAGCASLRVCALETLEALPTGLNGSEPMAKVVSFCSSDVMRRLRATPHARLKSSAKSHEKRASSDVFSHRSRRCDFALVACVSVCASGLARLSRLIQHCARAGVRANAQSRTKATACFSCDADARPRLRPSRLRAGIAGEVWYEGPPARRF